MTTAATGEPEELDPGVVRLIAPNPSPMTERGTNSYLLGRDRLCVIDPGPDLPQHLDALLRAIGSRQVSHILVTHAHRDHSELAPALAAATGAPVMAFGDPRAGRSPLMERLAGLEIGGGEGVDATFSPDRCLADGAQLMVDGHPLHAWHTPGHMGNHMCFEWNGDLFSGDLVMGWASSLVSPPDGDLGHFRTSCRRMSDREPRRLLPGHGAPVDDPVARIEWLLAHRRSRERQILDCLANGPATPALLTSRLYADTPVALHPAAMRNVLAHLLDLTTRRLVTPDQTSPIDALYCLT